MERLNSGGQLSVECYAPNERPFGISFGQWTVKWWRWLLSCPSSINPASDKSGINSSLNQNGPVWYLAGTFGEDFVPHRECSIPDGKCIFFPIINFELNNLENPEFTTDEELISNVKKDEDDITNQIANVDGLEIVAWRVESDPKIFHVDLPPENCLQIQSKRIKIASDGYWIFLKPLSKGKHKIFFHASCTGGLRSCTAFYDLNIV